MTQGSKQRLARKPEKPYPDFPLTANGNGMWSKKIRQRVYYFGPWSDWQGALDKWNQEKDYLLAGKEPPRGDQATVERLANEFLHAKKLAVQSGDLTQRSWKEYKRTCQLLIDAFGRYEVVERLTPADFGKLRAKLAAKWGPTTLANEINRCRIVCRWGYQNGLLDRPIKFGDQFKPPSMKRQREARHAVGARMFEAAELRRIITAAGVPLRAWILLAVNAGFGQHDLALLPQSAVDLKGGWVNFPRPKTGTQRRCALWPETIKALREAIKARPEPRDAADASLVFLTRHGRRLVRQNASGKESWVDSVGLQFGKLLRKLNIKRPGINFYSLRRTFRTIADEARDDDAAAFIMGHTDESDMGQRYTQRIGDDRLKAITDHVHAWLYPPKKKRGATKN